MAQVEPLKLEDSIGSGLNAFSKSVTHTDTFDKFVFRRLEMDCETLQKTNVVKGSLHRAFLYSTIGNFEEVERWITNAEKNGGVHEARIERITHFVNHGFASKALVLLDQAFDNHVGDNLMDMVGRAATIGAFGKIVAAVTSSKLKGEVVQVTNLYPLSVKAVGVVNSLGISDGDLAAMLDVAGEMLREKKLLWQETLPDITVLEVENGGPALGIEYRIDVTPVQASRMSWALVEELIERKLDRPNVLVGFLGTALENKLAA